MLQVVYQPPTVFPDFPVHAFCDCSSYQNELLFSHGSGYSSNRNQLIFISLNLGHMEWGSRCGYAWHQQNRHVTPAHDSHLGRFENRCIHTCSADSPRICHGVSKCWGDVPGQPRLNTSAQDSFLWPHITSASPLLIPFITMLRHIQFTAEKINHCLFFLCCILAFIIAWVQIPYACIN